MTKLFTGHSAIGSLTGLDEIAVLSGGVIKTSTYTLLVSSLATSLAGSFDAAGAAAAAAAASVPTTRTVNSHALSSNVVVTKSDVSLSSVTDDVQTKAAIVPNTAPAAGKILVGNAGGTAYAPVSVSGDITISALGVVAIGSGKVTEAMQVLANNTTNNVSSAKHGYVPKLSDNSTEFLSGSGAWATPLTNPPVHLRSLAGPPTVNYTLGDGGSGSVNAATDLDCSGELTITTVVGGVGEVAIISYASGFSGNARVVLTPSNAEAAAVQVYITGMTTSGWRLSALTLAAGTTYKWNYVVVDRIVDPA